MQVAFFPTITDLNAGLDQKKREGRVVVAIKFITRQNENGESYEVFYLLHAPRPYHNPQFRKKDATD